MQCKAVELSKYYNNHVIFEDFNYLFETAKNYVILGGNGSGKSTLLKIIAGASETSEGTVDYSINGNSIKPQNLIQHLSLCAPYLGLIEEFTFKELILFQQKFKPFMASLKAEEIIALSELKNIENKLIKHYSSGMKQRVRLLLTLLTDVNMVLLDEPVSNLDPSGKQWYQKILNTYSTHKTVLVASNYLEEEYPQNPTLIHLNNFKNKA